MEGTPEEKPKYTDSVGQPLEVGDWVTHPSYPRIKAKVTSFTATGWPRVVWEVILYDGSTKRHRKPFSRQKVVKIPSQDKVQKEPVEDLSGLVEAYKEENEKLTLEIISLEEQVKLLLETKPKEDQRPTELDVEPLRRAMSKYLTAPRFTFDESLTKGPTKLGDSKRLEGVKYKGITPDEELYWNPEKKRWDRYLTIKGPTE